MRTSSHLVLLKSIGMRRWNMPVLLVSTHFQRCLGFYGACCSDVITRGQLESLGLSGGIS